MKTAMQELSKYVDEMQDGYIALAKADKKNKELQTRVDAVLTATTLIQMQIKDGGLEKEKEQIRNAYNDGYFAAYKYKDWEEYYKQNFNQNK
jgi:ribulose bisphosphate carboxylase small subunit